MAQQLSDLQKAALDFMIEYKKHDDSFIDFMNDVANATAKAAQAITDAATYVGQQAVNYAQNNPAQAAGNVINTVARVAQVTEEGGIEATASAPGAAPKNVTLQDLINLRHGIR